MAQDNLQALPTDFSRNISSVFEQEILDGPLAEQIARVTNIMEDDPNARRVALQREDLALQVRHFCETIDREIQRVDRIMQESRERLGRALQKAIEEVSRG